MALPALATLAELEARLGIAPGGLAEPDKSRAQAALADASSLVREESRRNWMDTSTPPVAVAPDALVRIVLAAAKRDYRNPDGLTSETDTAGPFTRTRARKDDESTVYLTDSEQEICRRYRETTKAALWTQPTTRGECEDNTLWLPTSQGGPFPIGADADRWWV